MTPRHLKFMPLVRELFECTRAFEQCSDAHIRELHLTPAQFDIIATLGNTQGMCFRELGDKTLITKGTLTGVVDRLEQKGLVRRGVLPDDRRMKIVQLTAEGEKDVPPRQRPPGRLSGREGANLPRRQGQRPAGPSASAPTKAECRSAGCRPGVLLFNHG